MNTRPSFADIESFLNSHYNKLASGSFKECQMPAGNDKIEFDPYYVYKRVSLLKRHSLISEVFKIMSISYLVDI